MQPDGMDDDAVTETVAGITASLFHPLNLTNRGFSDKLTLA